MAELDKKLDPTEVAAAPEATDMPAETAVAAEDLFADLGSDFAVDAAQEEAVVMDSEDYTGFAKGFPDWDLLPPKA